MELKIEQRDPGKLISGAVHWLKEYYEQAGLQSWIVGVSGGIDSTVVERLCEATGKPIIAIAMPMWMHTDSDPNSLRRAMNLCVGRKDVHFQIRPIGSIVEAYKKAGIAISGSNQQLSQGNLRSRIRADILRDAAGASGGCVVGTGNYDEDAIGYFTKGGDGDVDLCPLSLIHKCEVYAMAKEFGNAYKNLYVPKDNCEAIPTAGLWDYQTDESELGMKYDEIGEIIEFQNHSGDKEKLFARQREVFDKVEHMRKVNAHKLAFPPVYRPES